jgi:hypothetical protein
MPLASGHHVGDKRLAYGDHVGGKYQYLDIILEKNPPIGITQSTKL